MYFKEIIRTVNCDLLEPQHVIVELILQCPFLVHQVGTKWVDASFLALASVPTGSIFLSILYFILIQKANFNSRRTTP